MLKPVTATFYDSAANIDFDPFPVLVTFAPKDRIMCGNIFIYDDAQLGESREVFAVVLGLPESPYIDYGSTRIATVEVTDTPGGYWYMQEYHSIL